MPFLKKKSLLCIIVIQIALSLINNNSLSAASAAEKELAKLVQDALKTGGQGLLNRIRNMTDYSADIKFDPIIHDKLPKYTTIRIKRTDGMYLTCRKVDNKPKAIFEAIEASDAATVWIVDRLKDEALQDWIGLSHTNS
ncbi:hypothetical protein FJ364_01175, partial [Candidatus Dependentiae bacterium]|nr:hypothetical protein [Candidatus Dependentiae bacterium]